LKPIEAFISDNKTASNCGNKSSISGKGSGGKNNNKLNSGKGSGGSNCH